MKKFFKKHDLTKVVLIVLLVAILFTWIFPEAYYEEGKLVLSNAEKFGLFSLVDADARLGIFDIVLYGFLSIYYFIDVFVYVLVLGGFYKFIGSLSAYGAFVDGVAKKFEGKESVFVAISTFVFTVLASIVMNQLVLLLLVPLVLSILAKLKVDKVTGISATFGGILVGTLASTVSSKVTGNLVQALKVSYGFEWLTVVVVGLIAYVLLTLLNVIRMGKVSGNKDVAVTKDSFRKEDEKENLVKKAVKNAKNKVLRTKKVNVVPFVTVFVITFAIVVLAFIDWKNAFNVTLFDSLYASIQNAKIGGLDIFFRLLGATKLTSDYSFTAFGNWTLFSVVTVLLVSSFILKIVYSKSFDNYLDEMVLGVKKVFGAFIPFALCMVVLEFSILFVRVPGIVDAILGLGTNWFTLFISSIVGSIFTIDMQYTASLFGSAYAAVTDLNVSALAMQFGYGLFGFFAPTSALLMLGLGMQEVKYSEWLKHIWKFVAAMFVVICVVLFILTVM